MPDNLSPAIAFYPYGFEATSDSLRGLAVANQSFVRGLVRHGELEALHGYLLVAGCDAAFEQLAQEVGATMPTRIIKPQRLDQLSQIGILKLGGPELADAARVRSFVGHRAYALSGVTHTTAGLAMRCFADLVAADIQPWDAVVCTSRAVAAMVTEILQAEEERFAERLQATRFARPMLPVIPLGIETDRFTSHEEWRQEWRKRLGIGPDDVVVLYVGRLTRVQKAHPLPMFAALGAVAQGQKLHLVLAGYWQDPSEETLWREDAAALCPEVGLHVVDAREATVRRQIWSSADIFTFLIDNIQETFGLAPVEAMAAGLPVVATDWDGLRDTVRHGVDGMLIPTLMAPPGEGLRSAMYLAAEAIDESCYFASVAQRTAVDIGAAVEAFRALVADPSLRRSMGAAGQARAREVFDWAAVIPQYQALWREQEALRQAEPVMEVGLGFSAPDPRYMDPMQAFAAWPSRTFQFSQRIRPVPTRVDARTLLRMTALVRPSTVDETDILQLLDELQRRGEATAEELLDALEPAQRDAAGRGILRLLRTGLATTV